MMNVFYVLALIVALIIVCETIEKISIYRSYKSLTPEQLEALSRNAKQQ